MSARQTLTCGRCGGEFERFPSHLRRPGYGQYCSVECRNAAARKPAVRGANACIRHAYALGYRPTEDGRVLNPDGGEVRQIVHPRTRYRTFSARECRSPISVHRFVAFHLYGEEAMGAECVRHLNDDRADNRFANILHGTKSENQLDIPVERRRQMGVRRNRGKRQFTDDQVREIRLLLAEGWSLNRLVRVFNCSPGAITNIRDGRTYLDVQ